MPNQPIILASASAQRKKLLTLSGVRFKVVPSRVEEATRIKTTCAAFVKHNALIKGREVAGRLKKGIVISADTTVFGGNKQIIGKPRDLQEARRILKRLFSRPHWVYTGVAVIDAGTMRTEIDYEKTKVFMHKLSDKEIHRYHSLTSPLDKAGGFDIEGKGGFFINRIEGCYSNVIGLPMAKLRVMLKKFGVTILSLLMAVGISGCASEFNLATGEQENLIYGTEKEVRIGDAVAKQIEENYKIINDWDVNQRVQTILSRIVAVCDRKDIVYTIRVIDEESVNAVSLPGGYIYVFKGLMDKIDSDDELAGVIAHEVGHVTARHGIKRLQAAYGYALLQALAIASQSPEAVQGASAIYTSVFLAYSRKDEFQSDELGVKYMEKAGYDPDAMLRVLDILWEEQQKAPIRPITYFRTHPYIRERMAIVRKAISGQLDFKGYLNLTGNEY